MVRCAVWSEPVSSLHYPAFGQDGVFGSEVDKMSGRKWLKTAVLEEKFPTCGCRQILGLLQGIPQKEQGTGFGAQKSWRPSNVGRRERRDDASDALQRRRTKTMQGPWYFFHPDSPGYLQRKLDEGEPVSRAELVRVFEANPGFAWEGALHKLYCQMLNGSFKGKPGPRERLSWSMWQCINAWAICEYDRRPTPILPYGCIQTVAEQHELAPWMGRF